MFIATKYDVENPQQNIKIKIKTKNTLLKKYNATSTFASPIIKEKIKKSLLEKYSVDNVSKSKEVINKIYRKKKENHTLNSSRNEEKIEEILDTLVKEKKCKTTFKKIVGNTYLYGNQRITAKLEGEEVKVLYGNNNTFIPVEEFIDINESKTIVKKNNRKSSIKTKKGVPKK